MKRYLCIDYGRSYIGLSLATTPIAEPLKTIPNQNSIQTIQDIIDQHHINCIIMGISEGAMAQEIRAYSKKLQKSTNLPIIFHDETLSSHDTRQHIAQAKLKKSRREQKIDHLVAATILQDYLNSTNQYH